MRVKYLKINNLRNIESISIDLDPSLNCFIGDNGAGKTTILEALAVMSKGRSFRPGQIPSLIGPSSPAFQIITTIKRESNTRHQIGFERGVDYWTARHNGQDINQISELSRLLPHVVLEPSSHTLVSGSPDGRRKYLDWGVFHVKQGYLLLWKRYYRALKQRNAALRQQDSMVLESLDSLFVELGEQLHRYREQHAQKLSELLQSKLPLFNQTLTGIGLHYRKGWGTESLAETTRSSVERDMERGVTNHGPHKADLHLTLDGAPARERLSRGEQKALTSALVLIQAEQICASGEKPILLLDDLSSEFDEQHLEKVLRVGLDLGSQIWLTGTKFSKAIKNCGADYRMFHVEHGNVSPC